MSHFDFNPKYKLFIFLLTVSIASIIVDRGAGTLLKKFYFSQVSGDGYLTTYAIDSTDAEMLIFGSSRAKHHYDPAVFERNLEYSAFNAGRDGTNHILFNYAKFKAVTSRYYPKMIILDIRPEDLLYNTREYEVLSLLLPYYKDHPEIEDLIDLNGPFEKIKRFSAIYPYNSMIFQIALGNLNANKNRVTHNKGYDPLHRIMEENIIDTTMIENCNIDEHKIKAIVDLIASCRRNNIELGFVYSPTWSIIAENQCDLYLSSLCSDNGIKYFNFSNNPSFIKNPQYFSDRTHLNDKGAEVFSEMLAKQLKQTYQ